MPAELLGAPGEATEVELLRSVAQRLGVKWGHDDLGWWAVVARPAEWVVWRQDDNGHRFEVSRGHTREEAVRLVREFEARGHRQSYWTEPQA